MRKQVLYMGDGECLGPAGYLIGIMRHFNISYRHVASGQQPSVGDFDDRTGLVVISDYESSSLDSQQMRSLCACVENGAGLLMLGGWESFHGLSGDWDVTPLAELLPVEMLAVDDRRNCPQPVLVKKITAHPVVENLPFACPPAIGGYNEFRPRPGSVVVLQGERFHAKYENGHATFSAAGTFPLLVTDGNCNLRRACLATDVAPHWVGGFVDWGDSRLHIDIPNGFVEIGSDYAAFFRNLLLWGLGEI